MARHGLLFLSELNSVLLKNFSYWTRLALCWIMLATCRKNISRFFFKKMQSAALHYVDCTVLR